MSTTTASQRRSSRTGRRTGDSSQSGRRAGDGIRNTRQNGSSRNARQNGSGSRTGHRTASNTQVGHRAVSGGRTGSNPYVRSRTAGGSQAGRKAGSSAQARRRKERAMLMERKKRRLRIVCCVEIVIIVLFAVIMTKLVINLVKSPVSEAVTLEVGQEITTESFLLKDVKSAAFVTDMTAIDKNKPGSYPVTLEVNGKQYESKLVLQDTVPPQATAVKTTTTVGVLPNPEDCVTNIIDVTNVTVAFVITPEVSRVNTVSAVVGLTDEGGNETELEVSIEVIEEKDEEPPVISGVKDIEIIVGDSISYKKDVTVTDNEDPNPVLEIDNSGVDIDTPGEYTVTYTATDASGNTTTVTAKVIVNKKPVPEGEEEIYAMAEEILDQITDDSMDDMDVAFAIYRWTKGNIGYTGSSDKSDWIVGAYDGFTNRSGDCFTYFAVAKELFNVAGIENVDVVKSDTSHSRHYWSLINLGDGWYHVDCTPRVGSGDNFFMVTDEELEAYSVKHNNSHIFDGSLYPERATESVQDMVSYSSGKLKR